MSFVPPDFEIPELLETDRFRIGCLYIVPSHKDGSAAAAALWVRASEAAGDLDQVLYATARRWLAERWPFTRVAWPGRELPWDEYDALPDQ